MHGTWKSFVVSFLDIDQVLVVLLNEVRNLLNVTGTSIWLKDKDSWLLFFLEPL